MTAEWRDVVAVAVAVLSRQPPPAQIFVWLAVAFVVVMFVEGLRVSFLPYRFRKDVRHFEAPRAQAPSQPAVTRKRPQAAAFVRAKRSDFVRYKKLIDTAPRPHRAPRPRIRRVSSAFEMVPPEVRAQSSEFDAVLKP